MPIDTLKLDKDFFDDIESDDKEKQLIEDIIDIMKKLDISAVAEGIERASQVEFLEKVQCKNSQLAAKMAADILKDELISINQCLKAKRLCTFHSKKPFVFVVPTYGWRIPIVVEQWIEKTGFEGSSDAYFLLTCGGKIGNSMAYAQKICEQKKQPKLKSCNRKILHRKKVLYKSACGERAGYAFIGSAFHFVVNIISGNIAERMKLVISNEVQYNKK